MARVRVTKQARADLDSIVAYYEQVNLEYALVFEENVLAKVRQLERFPRFGRMVPEIKEESMRELIYRSYRIVYFVDEANAARLGATSRGGASIRSFCELGKSKGYVLIYCELIGVNLFFVHESCVDAFDLQGLTPELLYQPPQFGLLAGCPAPNGRGYP